MQGAGALTHCALQVQGKIQQTKVELAAAQKKRKQLETYEVRLRL